MDSYLTFITLWAYSVGDKMNYYSWQFIACWVSPESDEMSWSAWNVKSCFLGKIKMLFAENFTQNAKL